MEVPDVPNGNAGVAHVPEKVSGKKDRQGQRSKQKRVDGFRRRKNDHFERETKDNLGRELFLELPEKLTRTVLDVKTDRQVKPRSLPVDTAPLARMVGTFIESTVPVLKKLDLDKKRVKCLVLKANLNLFEVQMSKARAHFPQCGTFNPLPYELREFASGSATFLGANLFISGFGALQSRDEEYYPEYSNGDRAFNLRHHVRVLEIRTFLEWILQARSSHDLNLMRISPLWDFFDIGSHLDGILGGLQSVQDELRLLLSYFESEIITRDESNVYQRVLSELERTVQGSVRGLPLDGKGTAAQLVTVDRRFDVEEACCFKPVTVEDLQIGGILAYYTVWPNECTHHPLRHPECMSVYRRDYFESIRDSLSQMRVTDKPYG